MRSVFAAFAVLGISLSVPFLHEWTLDRGRRERVVEETQILSLRRQLEAARAELAELSRLEADVPDQLARVAKVEHAVGSL
ncbi:MAG TPA: hypothetical protein VKE69_03880, partial [Planctomycetota bacterium]|nr:hypothetical protein [Planctomycetota bacterium]